jgi:hypothetical protein
MGQVSPAAGRPAGAASAGGFLGLAALVAAVFPQPTAQLLQLPSEIGLLAAGLVAGALALAALSCWAAALQRGAPKWLAVTAIVGCCAALALGAMWCGLGLLTVSTR